MMRLLAVVVVASLCVAVLWSQEDELPAGTYRKQAKPKVIEGWKKDRREKGKLVPGPPAPHESSTPAVDFSGAFRFGRYDYTLIIRQSGDQVSFESGGVDHQDIGGAFETVGAGVVRGDRIYARWWCLDITRNYANNGGCEMWYHKGDRNRIYVTYYHDADERIEDGYGVRLGTHEGEMQHYRIRMKHPVKRYRSGLELKGTVKTRAGRPLADAVVMLRHRQATAVRTDADGRWSITVNELPTVQMVSAARPGYRIAVEAILRHKVRELDFVLDESPFSDDPAYVFLSPRKTGSRNLWNCGNCHRNSFDEWSTSRHSLAAKSAITRAVYEKDFLPALARGEAHGDAGLCAACHAPSASLDGRSVRLTDVKGVDLEGNHCDFCHKIHHTEDLEAPGVRGGLKPGRPSPGDARVPGPIKRVYGTLPDSDYIFMGPTYNPYFSTGALCAGCHQYTPENGVPALNTYGEWQDWAATTPLPQSCQDCHMPSGTSLENKKLARRIAINAVRRPQEQIHDHSFLGRLLMAEAVEVEVAAKRNAGGLDVVTKLRTRRTGHKVPTGSADKHLLLVVLALSADGSLQPLAEGPLVPDHAGGRGDPLDPEQRVKQGDFAGLPGREFAQVLVDAAGNTHVPFWRAVKLKEDTRLAPDATERVDHRFSVKGKGAVKVRVLLIHRLRFKEHDVAHDAKGAGVRPLDLVIYDQTVEVR